MDTTDGACTYLSDLLTNQEGVIAGFDPPGRHQMMSRLATLGFTPGTVVRMVHNYGRGPIIVQIRDTRIALGRGEARRVCVVAEPVSTTDPPQPLTSGWRHSWRHGR